MFNQVLQRHPFLRLLIMLGIGIVCGDIYPYALSTNVFWGGAILTLTFLLVCFYRNWHMLFSASILLASAALGFTLMGWKLDASNFTFNQKEAVYRIIIEEHPEEKPRSILCRSIIEEIWANDSTMKRVKQKKLFLLYFEKDSVSRQLRRGDVLWINARLTPPRNNHNPDEFDYARFLKHRGVCGTGYVPAGHWKRISHRIDRSFTQQAMDQRDKIVASYRNMGFQQEELAVLSALTVGDKDDLSEDIIETYSVTGASHVLALSGMHIGFLYALFWFLFSPLWKHFRFLKPILLLVIILLLWGFAFLTGLSPSVVRSVVMFSILALSCLQTEKPLSANTLIITAFCMLLYNPCWLYDVGFQLSFTAVAAILIFYSKLYVLLSAPLPALQQLAVWSTEKLIRLQNDGLRYIEQWPYASIDHWWIDIWTVALFYVALLFVYRSIQARTARSMGMALASVLLLFSYNAWCIWHNTPKTGLAFYNVHGCPAVHCLTNSPRSWLACADSVPDTTWLFRSLDTHWSRLRLDSPRVITNNYAEKGIALHDKLLLFQGVKICLLNDDRWRYKEADIPLTIDYAYISKGYKGNLSELSGVFSIRRVIIDSSLSTFYRERILTDCRKMGIPYQLLEEGYIHVSL